MRHNQRGHLKLLDDIGNGKGLAGAGCAKQHLMAAALAQILNQLGNRFWLIASRLIGGL